MEVELHDLIFLGASLSHFLSSRRPNVALWAGLKVANVWHSAVKQYGIAARDEFRRQKLTGEFWSRRVEERLYR